MTQAVSKLKLKTTQFTYLISVPDIIHIEAHGAYTKFFIEEQNILLSKNLRYYESLLEGHNFIRVHQSHLVNADKIKRLSSSEVLLSNSKTVPISTRKRRSVMSQLSRIEASNFARLSA